MNYNTWIFKFLLAMDIFFCSIVWRDPNVTISSMVGLELKKTKPKWWAKFLGKVLGKPHCANAIEFDIGRAQNAIKMLQQ